MKVHLRCFYAATLFAVVSVAISLTSTVGYVSAAALPKGTLTWTLARSQVTAGSPISAKLNYVRMPVGSRVDIEVESGSSTMQRVLQRYAVRGRGSRTIALPGVPMGSYRYRVTATYSNGKLIANSTWQKLYSYGDVPLARLCVAQGAIVGGDGCQGGDIQVASNLFIYAIEGNGDLNKPPQYGTIINFPATTCRSLSLNMALDSNNSKPGDTAFVQVIETSLAPQLVTVSQGAVTTFNVNLDGGPFLVQNSSSAPDYVFYNGTGSCWSSSGV